MRKASVWVAVVVVAIVAGSSLALSTTPVKPAYMLGATQVTGYRHQASHHAASNRVGPI